MRVVQDTMSFYEPTKEHVYVATNSRLIPYLLDNTWTDLVLGERNIVLLSEVVGLVAGLPHVREVPGKGDRKGETTICEMGFLSGGGG